MVHTGTNNVKQVYQVPVVRVHALKAYWTVKMQLHACFTVALRGNERSAVQLGYFQPETNESCP